LEEENRTLRGELLTIRTKTKLDSKCTKCRKYKKKTHLLSKALKKHVSAMQQEQEELKTRTRWQLEELQHDLNVGVKQQILSLLQMAEFYPQKP